jgi:archaellum component FlaC
MAFGGATKKLQTLADTAEKVYERLNELRAELEETRETVDETRDRVDALEEEVADQRALVEAMARDAGVDVERVLAEAAIKEAEPQRAEDDGTVTGSGD